MTNKILPILIILSAIGIVCSASSSAFGSPAVSTAQDRNVVCGEYTCTFTPLADAHVEIAHDEVEIQHIPIVNITIPHTEIEITFIQDVK